MRSPVEMLESWEGARKVASRILKEKRGGRHEPCSRGSNQ